MALTAKKVYAILKRQISDMEAKLNSPVRYRGTVATADLLPLNPDIGDMYNIESKSVYGEAGMNVAWNGVVWDTMGAPIDMSLYIKSSELADWVKQQNKPTYTAEEVGALPDTTVIPSKTSDLQNDSGFLTKIPDNYLSETDKTLSVSGKAADAKATGDKITELSADISNKLNKNQGSENSGKIAGINESGDIVPMFPVSVDYNEETNCLEFGSDQKMELNKGINLDSTLTKTGYAADAGAVGEITNSLKEDLSNKITKFYASNQGETHITDSDNGKIQDMMIYGKSSQDGTPSPENPAEIKSVVNPTVKVTNEDGLKVQSVTLNNIILNAIPVSSGGNVTIGEQQYISDYVDVEKGKLYRKVKRLNLKDVDDIGITHGFHSNGNGYLSFSIGSVNKEQRHISNRYKSSEWTQESGYSYIPNNDSIVFVDDRFTDRQTAIKLVQDTYVIYALSSQTEEDLSSEQIKSLKSLSTYYPTTNISVNSEQLDGYTVFNYPTPFEDEWNKTQKEIGSLKEDMTSKADKTALVKTDRKLDALWKLNQGISYEFQTDDTVAYQKTVPSGVKLASVKKISGRTIVWNQLADNSHVRDWGETFIANKHYNKIENHMLYFRHKIKVKSVINEQDTNTKRIIVFTTTTTKIIGNVDIKKDELKAGYENIVSVIEKMPKDITDISVYNCGNDKVGNTAECEASLFVADLTQMFGSGNEPSTPEEFEAMFPADYYPYNAGELMSASVNEVIYLDTKNQETSYPIPQAILDLDGYGESGNFVDFVEKKYRKGDRTIDISDIIGDTFQEPLEVEAGGTLTFKNSHGDDYRIPVPSSEEYVISLAEVAK